jgi:hypothetical protein
MASPTRRPTPQAERAEDATPIDTDGDLCERDVGPEVIEATLQGIDLALHPRELALDGDDVLDAVRRLGEAA